MSPDVWKLHAALFELARARYLGPFRVDTKAHPGGAVVELVLEGPQRALPAVAVGGAPTPSSLPAFALAPR